MRVRFDFEQRGHNITGLAGFIFWQDQAKFWQTEVFCMNKIVVYLFVDLHFVLIFPMRVYLNFDLV